MCRFKILKISRYKELIQKERTLDCRVMDSEASTYDDLLELKRVLLKEINSVEYRLRQIQNIYTNLSKK